MTYKLTVWHFGIRLFQPLRRIRQVCWRCVMQILVKLQILVNLAFFAEVAHVKLLEYIGRLLRSLLLGFLLHFHLDILCEGEPTLAHGTEVLLLVGVRLQHTHTSKLAVLTSAPFLDFCASLGFGSFVVKDSVLKWN